MIFGNKLEQKRKKELVFSMVMLEDWNYPRKSIFKKYQTTSS